MQKVDRLGWAVGFSLRTYGVRVGIRSNDPVGLERVCEHLPYEWQRLSSSIVDRLYSIIIGGRGPLANLRRLNLLYGDHMRLARSFDVDEVFHTFESDLRLIVAEFARHRVFVHAGVVGWEDQAIVIPGRSYSGKSTLVAELVRAGATYYSDEYAVFDSRGRVHPFFKPLELRLEGRGGQEKIDVGQIGGQSGTKPLPVGLVLVTRFKSKARWRPRKLTAGQGILDLLANTVSARRNPERALTTLRQVVGAAEILKGARGEGSEIARALLDRVGQKKGDS